FVGDADGGFAEKQSGGWVFNVLPFIEQGAIRQLGAGMSAADKRRIHAQRESMAIPIMHCPSRRSARAYTPNLAATNVLRAEITGQARTDYAANYGNSIQEPATAGQVTFVPADPILSVTCAAGNPPRCYDMTRITGVSFKQSRISKARISDGTSNTYMLGEKYMNVDYYENGLDTGDDWSMYSGQQDDIYRETFLAPLPDYPGLTQDRRFGSAHPAGLHFALCIDPIFDL
ncbi:MAG TPA: DUF1559 domain-containing protein, partial [Lacipirellulaceae bacterium]|nr:DUF1559 domain-containing protein [Lacipirellulaceae bacterium]